MKFPYSSAYEPSMPALQVKLGYPDGALVVGPILAIVDTGADGTLVPQAIVDDLGAPFVDAVRVRGHWGEWQQAQVFMVDLGIDGIRLPVVEVVGDEIGTEMILGRNALNRLKLLLDGPAGQVEILDS